MAVGSTFRPGHSPSAQADTSPNGPAGRAFTERRVVAEPVAWVTVASLSNSR